MLPDDEQAIKLRLLADIPIAIADAGFLRAPKLRLIAEICETHYNRLVAALLFDASQLEDVEADGISPFDLFCAYCRCNEPFRSLVLEGLALFFQTKAAMAGAEEMNRFVLGDPAAGASGASGHIHAGNFDRMQTVLKLAHHMKLPQGPEFRPANSRAKEMIDRIVKSRRSKPTGKQEMNLHSIVSGMAWRSPDLSIAAIFDLTIYQLYDGFFRLDHIDNYQFTMSGLYAGTVDGSQLNFASIHWTTLIP